jgi:nitroreductase/Pyruvate/2-oxoacid:ferredoxin oxidoreductase delta subunit
MIQFFKRNNEMLQSEVNENKCTRCGICAAECPIGIIASGSGEIPSLIKGKEEFCISCGHCVAVCPHGAFSLGGIKPEDCAEVRSDPSATVEQVGDIIRSRRSIRSYRNEPVPKETLLKLIDIARYAPTGSNSQLVQWIVIDSPAEVHDLAGMVIDSIRDLVQRKDPSAMKYRFERFVTDWESGKDGIFRGAPSLVIAHASSAYGLASVDCSIALSFLDIASPSFGLGTCWAGIFMRAVTQWEPLRKRLAIPEGNSCFGAMMVGFPKYGYHRIPPRKEVVVSWR